MENILQTKRVLFVAQLQGENEVNGKGLHLQNSTFFESVMQGHNIPSPLLPYCAINFSTNTDKLKLSTLGV